MGGESHPFYYMTMKTTRRQFLSVLGAAAVFSRIPQTIMVEPTNKGLRSHAKTYAPRGARRGEMHFVVVPDEVGGDQLASDLVEAMKFETHPELSTNVQAPTPVFNKLLSDLKELHHHDKIEYYGILSPESVVGIDRWAVKGSDLCLDGKPRRIIVWKANRAGENCIAYPICVTPERNFTLTYEVTV
ncbi:hypothetical protein GR11A_00206 [Vibrio phage vB_VcorM_GR11A]|nr:hypothetical protein GR11A_00206 [Vibrio phage vB_VcorM_GR11A]